MVRRTVKDVLKGAEKQGSKMEDTFFDCTADFNVAPRFYFEFRMVVACGARSI